MIETKYRPIAETERRLIERLLEPNFPGRDELVRQLDGLNVRRIDQEGSLALEVRSNTRANVRSRVPVDARYADVDTKNESGPHVNILLHVGGGSMVELEIFKDDQSKIMTSPYTAQIEVNVRA